MPAVRHTTHTVDPVYATPVLRPPSPTDTLDSEFGQDETSVEDKDLDDEEFGRRIEVEIGLRRTSWDEAGVPKPVILPRTKDPKEEQLMFEAVMKNLREKVKEVEEEERFDTIVHQNRSPAFFDPQPAPQDIHTIMRSMMLPPSKSAESSANQSMGTAAPRYPFGFGAQMSRANGENSSATVTGLRYGNSGRTQ